MGYIEVILTLFVVAIFIYKWATAHFKSFEQRGIPFEKPVALFGNSMGIITGTSSFQKEIMEFYHRNRHHKIVGYFNFRLPMYMINDPEYIKKITIKDFENFPNHMPFFKTKEPMLLNMLSLMKDQRWKSMRNTLTPVFTAAKMRTMFGLMNECFDESLQYLKSKSINGGSFEVELKEVCSRLSNDLIASTAFGLKVNSFVDRDNKFYQTGNSVAFFRGKQMYKFMLANMAPWLMNALGWTVFDQDKTDYFIRLVIDTMKNREEKKIVRPDMIQLLLEAKKESTENWTDDEIVAQCFIFFFAAFENNANLICTTTYELLLNPDVQEKLYEECLTVEKELNGAALCYDVVNKMKYMNMVINESLRKWSLAASTDRVCSKDYTLVNEDGQKVFNFKEGDRIWIPIAGLHWDARYFESPEIFDPERFSDENKDNIVPFTYLPFGAGPRICIANRYALMQAKAMMYYLIINFKVERCEKTVKNLLDDLRGFQMSPKSGYWMNMIPRKSQKIN